LFGEAGQEPNFAGDFSITWEEFTDRIDLQVSPSEKGHALAGTRCFAGKIASQTYPASCPRGCQRRTVVGKCFAVDRRRLLVQLGIKFWDKRVLLAVRYCRTVVVGRERSGRQIEEDSGRFHGNRICGGNAPGIGGLQDGREGGTTERTAWGEPPPPPRGRSCCPGEAEGRRAATRGRPWLLGRSRQTGGVVKRTAGRRPNNYDSSRPPAGGGQNEAAGGQDMLCGVIDE